MTVPVHSHQFYVGRQTAAGAVTRYTTPTGYLAVLKGITLGNSVSPAKLMGVLINGAAFVALETVAASGVAVETVWVAVPAGQTIGTYVANATAGDFALSGYLYPLTL